MPTTTEYLETIRANAYAALAEGNTKPSYTLDGQHVDWSGYEAGLWARIHSCDEKLGNLAPFEVTSYGYVG